MPTKPVSKKSTTTKKTTTAKTTVKKAASSAKTKTPSKSPAVKAKAPVEKKAVEKEVPKNVEQVKVEQKTASVAQQKPATAVQQNKAPVAESPKEEQSKEDELFGALGEPSEPQGQAEVYDEMIARETEREIIRSQRKQMAGKDTKKDSRKYVPQKYVGPILDRVIEIPEVISVKEFAEKTGLGAAKVIGELMKNGVLANINQQIDFDTAQIIADDFRVRIKKKVTAASAEDVYAGNLDALLKNEDPENLKARPAIVVIMGHVDHGKTSLLDKIRSASVASGESGGITQHIGAYQVEKNGKKITFLDTPGHEAFTAMRARGAKVTDIAILVVAADEGIKPQTVEAIQHAQDAGVPIIVAINKIDKPGADLMRVKGELGEYELVPEDWGGKTIMVPVSALTGEGIPQLLEMVLLTAELENLKANPNRAAVGTVIEAHLDQNLGPIATVIVNSGTLRIMDNVVVGSAYGRMKVMKDFTGKNLREAGPSTPVLIAGLSSTPQSGDIFHVVADDRTARTQATNVQTLREADMISKRGVGEIISQITSGQLKHLKLVLKADTKGSLEAIRQALAQIKNDDVAVKVILAGVGNITESDVMMAAAANGIVMGFHVDVNLAVKRTAERENVEILHYTIIYKLLDDIRKILTGMLEPEEIETILGRAEVRKVFMTEKKQMIVGCKIMSGHVERVKVRVFRKEEKVGDGNITTLKHFDKNVNEVSEGAECGIMYTGFMPLVEGDILEAYKMEKRIRTL